MQTINKQFTALYNHEYVHKPFLSVNVQDLLCGHPAKLRLSEIKIFNSWLKSCAILWG